MYARITIVKRVKLERGAPRVQYLLIGTSGSNAAEARANFAQQDACIEACRGAGLVVFNMFALEGFHVSEAYSVSRLRECYHTCYLHRSVL